MNWNLYSLLLLMTAVLLFVRCRDSELKRMPDTLPDVTGSITQLSVTEQNRDDNVLTIRVQATETEAIRITEASIKVTEETKIEDQAGKDLSLSALKQGQEIDVWFGDKVIGSSPIQADAIAIRIRSQK